MHRLSAGRLLRAGQHRRASADLLGNGLFGGHRDLFAVVVERQRGVRPIPERIGGPVRLNVDSQPSAVPLDGETQPGDAVGKLGCEGQQSVVLSQAAKAGDLRYPDPS